MGDAVLGVLRGRAETESSFADVFNAHHRGAVRLAWLLTGDPHLAEDVVADAFAKVWVQWEKGRVHDVGPYLRRAVVNNVRSRGRRRQVELRELEKRSGDERGVQTHDEASADRDAVWQALSRLPDRQRQAIVLRYYEDLPEAEVAEILGVRVGTVKSQVSRGLDRLRDLVETSGAGGRPPGREGSSRGGER
jgi:RNA polymerase sigma-70 factor (sigma-E family)